MSIIAAIHDSVADVTWIGSDTAATIGGHQFVCGPKFHRAGPWAIGISGEGRFDTLIRNNLSTFVDEDAASIVEKVRDLILADGFKPLDGTGSKSFSPNSMIIAGRLKVFTIGGDFSLDRAPDDVLWADGSGRDFALGAAFALAGTSAEGQILRAVEAAIHLNVGCGGQPWIDKV